MCNCNHCGWQNAALASISCAGNGAELISNRDVSAAWRDYYAARSGYDRCGSSECGARSGYDRCGSCGCGARGGYGRCGSCGCCG